MRFHFNDQNFPDVEMVLPSAFGRLGKICWSQAGLYYKTLSPKQNQTIYNG